MRRVEEKMRLGRSGVGGRPVWVGLAVLALGLPACFERHRIPAAELQKLDGFEGACPVEVRTEADLPVRFWPDTTLRLCKKGGPAGTVCARPEDQVSRFRHIEVKDGVFVGVPQEKGGSPELPGPEQVVVPIDELALAELETRDGEKTTRVIVGVASGISAIITVGAMFMVLPFLIHELTPGSDTRTDALQVYRSR